MSTVTDYISQTQETKLLGTNVVKAENVIDFTVKNVLAGDVVQVVKVPKGALVTKVACYVVTAEGDTCTVTVGDADGANSWDASVNLNSTGGYYSAAGTDAYAHGKFYAAADTIDFTMGHNTDAAKVYVIAEYSLCEAIANA